MAESAVLIPCGNEETRSDRAAFGGGVTRPPAKSFLLVDDGGSAVGDIPRGRRDVCGGKLKFFRVLKDFIRLVCSRNCVREISV